MDFEMDLVFLEHVVSFKCKRATLPPNIHVNRKAGLLNALKLKPTL